MIAGQKAWPLQVIEQPMLFAKGHLHYESATHQPPFAMPKAKQDKPCLLRAKLLFW